MDKTEEGLDGLLPNERTAEVQFELTESIPANLVHVSAGGKRFQHELEKVERRWGKKGEFAVSPSTRCGADGELPCCVAVGRHLIGNVLGSPGILLNDFALLGSKLSVNERKTEASLSVGGSLLCKIHIHNTSPPPGCKWQRACLPRWCTGRVRESFEIWDLGPLE